MFDKERNAGIIGKARMVYKSPRYEPLQLKYYKLSGEPYGTIKISDVKKHNPAVVAIWNTGKHYIMAWDSCIHRNTGQCHRVEITEMDGSPGVMYYCMHCKHRNENPGWGAVDRATLGKDPRLRGIVE